MYINKLLTCAPPNVRGTHRFLNLEQKNVPKKDIYCTYF